MNWYWSSTTQTATPVPPAGPPCPSRSACAARRWRTPFPGEESALPAANAGRPGRSGVARGRCSPGSKRHSASPTPFPTSALTVPSARSTRSRHSPRYASTFSGGLLASPCRAHRIEPLLHPLAQMPVLPPAPRVPPPLAPSPGSDTAPHPTVNPNRWDMHVGLHHQRVTPPAQPPARLFSRDRVAALHHQSPHLRKQFRPHQRHRQLSEARNASCRRSRCGPKIARTVS